jgi:hypothetical protein
MMMKIATKAKVDPDLLAHIKSAIGPSSQVAAVVKLRPKDSQALTLPPVETQQVTEDVLDRVRQKLGEREQDYSVLDMLGAFNLVAPANFILELLKQPEVASAFSPEGEESAYIRPRNVKEVHLKAKR